MKKIMTVAFWLGFLPILTIAASYTKLNYVKVNRVVMAGRTCHALNTLIMGDFAGKVIYWVKEK